MFLVDVDCLRPNMLLHHHGMGVFDSKSSYPFTKTYKVPGQQGALSFLVWTSVKKSILQFSNSFHDFGWCCKDKEEIKRYQLKHMFDEENFS